ncbi:hypothetical protein LRS73_25225 [Methylobacterium currus]|uniref:hypothetical protein n=1 Tax=Methylobacterium currus TaxID=2051553 RepID=UPI000F507D61|nr:hypothetical protein [Methylobacterium currus]UHC15766.1 hypothetical protein LRS73_25225 [Methylobacterium currus]
MAGVTDAALYAPSLSLRPRPDAGNLPLVDTASGTVTARLPGSGYDAIPALAAFRPWHAGPALAPPGAGRDRALSPGDIPASRPRRQQDEDAPILALGLAPRLAPGLAGATPAAAETRPDDTALLYNAAQCRPARVAAEAERLSRRFRDRPAGSRREGSPRRRRKPAFHAPLPEIGRGGGR